jgi:hypothetical protein
MMEAMPWLKIKSKTATGRDGKAPLAPRTARPGPGFLPARGRYSGIPIINIRCAPIAGLRLP